jgi:hypothetical protein
MLGSFIGLSNERHIRVGSTGSPTTDSTVFMKPSLQLHRLLPTVVVLPSNAQGMEDMLLLRPPPKDLLEKGPPAFLREALGTFNERVDRSHAGAQVIAQRLGLLE